MKNLEIKELRKIYFNENPHINELSRRKINEILSFLDSTDSLKEALKELEIDQKVKSKIEENRIKGAQHLHKIYLPEELKSYNSPELKKTQEITYLLKLIFKKKENELNDYIASIYLNRINLIIKKNLAPYQTHTELKNLFRDGDILKKSFEVYNKNKNLNQILPFIEILAATGDFWDHCFYRENMNAIVLNKLYELNQETNTKQTNLINPIEEKTKYFFEYFLNYYNSLINIVKYENYIQDSESEERDDDKIEKILDSNDSQDSESQESDGDKIERILDLYELDFIILNEKEKELIFNLNKKIENHIGIIQNREEFQEASNYFIDKIKSQIIANSKFSENEKIDQVSILDKIKNSLKTEFFYQETLKKFEELKDLLSKARNKKSPCFSPDYPMEGTSNSFKSQNFLTSEQLKQNLTSSFLNLSKRKKSKNETTNSTEKKQKIT